MILQKACYFWDFSLTACLLLYPFILPTITGHWYHKYRVPITSYCDKTLLDTNVLYDQAGLMDRLKAGEEAAFAAVYHHFYKRAFFFARRFVGESDAQDTVSEAFIKVWAQRVEFTTLAGVGRFVFVLVRNRCLDILRHQVVRDQQHAALVHWLEESADQDLYLEQVRAELIRHVYAEVEKLPARIKEVFLLSFRDGLKPAEIAERLQLSVKTVKNQKITAIKLLKAAVGEHSTIVLLLLLVAADSLGSVAD